MRDGFVEMHVVMTFHPFASSASWPFARVSACVSCTGKSSSGHSIPDVSPVLSRKEGSPPSVYWQCSASCSPGGCLASAARTHFWFMVSLVSTVSLRSSAELLSSCLAPPMHLYISIWPTRRFTQCAHDISAAQFPHMRRIAQVILHCPIPSATPPPLLKTLCAAGAAHDKEYSGCSGLTWTKQGIFRSFSSIFFHYFSSIDELATHRNRSPAAVSQFTLLGFRSDHSYLIIDVQISEAWL